MSSPAGIPAGGCAVDNTPSLAGFAETTVFAVASGAGRSAIAVVRISGPATGGVLVRILGGRLPIVRRASLRTLRDPATGEAIDRALVLWMPGPASFTGEDSAELHIHGGVAVRSAILALLAREGCRAAEPGEFTRRAFRSGHLDLTEVEGLADLIEAETEGQRRQALRQAGGHLASLLTAWRDRLLDALALCEAELDFADEGDVPDDAGEPVAAIIAAVRGEIALALAGAERGERIRDGFIVVIVGRPNAGKSTLLNALARRDVAIVSPLPGTTRDAIEVRCDVGGLAVTLVDTAGLRETVDALEREGIARTRARVGTADLVLWLSPADEPDHEPDGVPPGVPILRVRTKADLAAWERTSTMISVSAATGQGLPELLAETGRALAGTGDTVGDAVLTRARHREVLCDAEVALRRAHAFGLATELVAEDLRLALRALGRMTGAVDVDDVLDRVFSSFCIGK